ncbi:MAG: hypothetical protein KGZ58_01125 [Ignavibacteriales bacterium]|nr:hypothetical protein [Ignavibacteriales bacterium]
MDARHQRDGRKVQGTGEHIYGKWQFFKMDIATEKIEKVKEGRALLEIGTARVIESVRSSDARRAYFGFSYHSHTANQDVQYFDAIEELKKGAKVFTRKAVYWAVHTAPTGLNGELMEVARQQLIAFAVIMNGETIGLRWLSVIDKAFEAAMRNTSIKFDGTVLFFISGSGKTRYVTKFGCHETCDCHGQISWHFALFELLKRYGVLANNVANSVRPFRRAA